MKHLKTLGLVALALASVPAAAQGVLAYATMTVNMHAGPAQEYPLVAVLQTGVAMSVEGCLSDYRWCDVVAGSNRGWVYAGNIAYPYQGANVPVMTYGAAIGIGIAAFAVGGYWDSYYRGRPWYPQRHLWVARPWPGYGGHPPPHGPGYGHPPPRPGYGPGYGRPTPPKPGYRPGGHPPPLGAAGGGSHRPPPATGGGGGGNRPSTGAGGGGGGHRPPQGSGGGQVHGGGQRP